MIARAIRGAQYRGTFPARSISRSTRAGARRPIGRMGTGAGGTISGGERRAATARRFGVRVGEAEPGAVQAVREVERRPVQDEIALRVDEDAHAVLLVDLVPLDGLLLEGQLVRHAGAAASDHRDP